MSLKNYKPSGRRELSVSYSYKGPLFLSPRRILRLLTLLFGTIFFIKFRPTLADFLREISSVPAPSPPAAIDPIYAWLEYNSTAWDEIEHNRVPHVLELGYNPVPEDVHVFSHNGLVEIGFKSAIHPIFEILDKAQTRWKGVMTAAGNNATRAISVYRDLENHRPQPPVASRSDVSSLRLFHAIPPKLLRERQKSTERLPATLTLVTRNGVSHVNMPVGEQKEDIHLPDVQIKAQILLESIQPEIATVDDLRATFSMTPYPRQSLPFQTIDLLKAYYHRGERITADELREDERIMSKRGIWRWEGGCRGKFDPAVSEDEGQASGEPPPVSFVHSARLASDVCLHHDLAALHPLFNAVGNRLHPLVTPILSEQVAPWASDVLVPPLLFLRGEDAPQASFKWSERKAGLYWRGKNNNPESVIHPVSRLLARFGPGEQGRELRVMVAHETKPDGFRMKRIKLREVGVIDVNILDEQDKAEDEQPWKYLLELEDPIEFRRKLMTGSLVFRPVILSDWFTERTVPWVHYVPVQPDFSDLPSLIAFFGHHDRLAQSIATEGQRWAESMLSRDAARQDLVGLLKDLAGLLYAE